MVFTDFYCCVRRLDASDKLGNSPTYYVLPAMYTSRSRVPGLDFCLPYSARRKWTGRPNDLVSDFYSFRVKATHEQELIKAWVGGIPTAIASWGFYFSSCTFVLGPLCSRTFRRTQLIHYVSSIDGEVQIRTSTQGQRVPPLVSAIRH